MDHIESTSQVTSRCDEVRSLVAQEAAFSQNSKYLGDIATIYSNFVCG